LIPVAIEIAMEFTLNNFHFNLSAGKKVFIFFMLKCMWS